MSVHQAADRGDQRRPLAMSTAAFTVCFAVWTIFSIIGIRIREALTAALGVGIAGGSFAVGLACLSRWSSAAASADMDALP